MRNVRWIIIKIRTGRVVTSVRKVKIVLIANLKDRTRQFGIYRKHVGTKRAI